MKACADALVAHRGPRSRPQDGFSVTHSARTQPRSATRSRHNRNAVLHVLHVPEKSTLLDKRIEQLVTVPDSPTTIRRIHRGFGRLFIEESGDGPQTTRLVPRLQIHSPRANLIP